MAMDDISRDALLQALGYLGVDKVLDGLGGAGSMAPEVLKAMMEPPQGDLGALSVVPDFLESSGYAPLMFAGALTEAGMRLVSKMPKLNEFLQAAKKIDARIIPDDILNTLGENPGMLRKFIDKYKELSATTPPGREHLPAARTVHALGLTGDAAAAGEKTAARKAVPDAVDAALRREAQNLGGGRPAVVRQKGLKIISGGQTGADRAGLDAAKELGFTTGGTAPKGWRVETGVDPSLKSYGLRESSAYQYTDRTLRNVLDGDGTVIFGDASSAGSRQTVNMAKQNNKPVIINPTPEQLRKFVADNDIQTLNVAGNRASKNPGVYEQAKSTIKEAFGNSNTGTGGGRPAVEVGAGGSGAKSMNIYYGTGENAGLSNLAKRPFTYKGRNYHSVEHAYQSNKSGTFDPDTYANPRWDRGGVKIMGRKGTDKNTNVSLMEDIIRESFSQNPDAAEDLLKTGDATLTHTQDRGIWKNKFPEILTKIRNELRMPATKTVGDPLEFLDEAAQTLDDRLTGLAGRYAPAQVSREYRGPTGRAKATAWNKRGEVTETGPVNWWQQTFEAVPEGRRAPSVAETDYMPGEIIARKREILKRGRTKERIAELKGRARERRQGSQWRQPMLDMTLDPGLPERPPVRSIETDRFVPENVVDLVDSGVLSTKLLEKGDVRRVQYPGMDTVSLEYVEDTPGYLGDELEALLGNPDVVAAGDEVSDAVGIAGEVLDTGHGPVGGGFLGDKVQQRLQSKAAQLGPGTPEGMYLQELADARGGRLRVDGDPVPKGVRPYDDQWFEGLPPGNIYEATYKGRKVRFATVLELSNSGSYQRRIRLIDPRTGTLGPPLSQTEAFPGVSQEKLGAINVKGTTPARMEGDVGGFRRLEHPDSGVSVLAPVGDPKYDRLAGHYGLEDVGEVAGPRQTHDPLAYSVPGTGPYDRGHGGFPMPPKYGYPHERNLGVVAADDKWLRRLRDEGVTEPGVRRHGIAPIDARNQKILELQDRQRELGRVRRELRDVNDLLNTLTKNILKSTGGGRKAGGRPGLKKTYYPEQLYGKSGKSDK